MLALVPVLVIVWKLWPMGYKKGDFKLLLSMVLFQPCLYFLFESYALQYTTSSQAGVIAASVPLMVTVGAWWILSESFHRQTFVGLILSIMGVVCLTVLGDPDGIAANPMLGNSLEFCAMMTAAVNLLIVKQLSQRYNPWILTAFQVISGCIFFSPGLYYLLQTEISAWNTHLILSLLFLGIFVSFSAFGLYNWAISRIPITKASVFINLIPVTAVALGWIMLEEKLNLYQCIAAVAVIFGVWLSQTSKKDELPFDNNSMQ